MNERWILRQRKCNYLEEGNRLGINPIVLRMLYNRDIKDDTDIINFFRTNKEAIYNYAGLPDIEVAARTLLTYLDNPNLRIRIIGDYDVDGVMSTYVLLEGLRLLRPNYFVDYALPNRQTDGYGLNTRLIDEAKNDNINLIITCDNGITAVEQIAYAKSLGINVIVTDHHEPSFTLVNNIKQFDTPECIAVIDPKCTNSTYSFVDICGAVVAFKLLVALFREAHKDITLLDVLIPYLTIATVCDVMPVIKENRDILRLGLPMLTNTTNIGLNALKNQQQILDKDVTTYIIGFVIGPCINAAGRLEVADTALNLLLAKTKEEADDLAKQLKAFNDERKELTDTMVLKAENMATTPEYRDAKVLVMYLKGCHESVAGIVAGRIKDITGKPTLIVTDSEVGLKGSARSIEAYNMYENLNTVKDLFIKFGGHEQAAGFSLDASNFTKLQQELNNRCTLTDDDLQPKVIIDMELPFKYVDTSLIDDLSKLEPYGYQNRKPLFVLKGVRTKDLKLVGKDNNVCQVKLLDPTSMTELRGVVFNNAGKFVELCKSKDTIDICFNLDINEWKGYRNIQVIIQHFR